MRLSGPPSPAEIERALTDCAKLIELGHEQLVPYFETLEQLLAEAQSKVDTLARIRMRVGTSSRRVVATAAETGKTYPKPNLVRTGA